MITLTHCLHWAGAIKNDFYHSENRLSHFELNLINWPWAVIKQTEDKTRRILASRFKMSTLTLNLKYHTSLNQSIASLIASSFYQNRIDISRHIHRIAVTSCRAPCPGPLLCPSVSNVVLNDHDIVIIEMLVRAQWAFWVGRVKVSNQGSKGVAALTVKIKNRSDEL